ncbi:MAG: hypothetical protein M0030_03400 [Actinomycetota bacterium]|nr:hypothetical protein [Actinomycetota bacterium]
MGTKIDVQPGLVVIEPNGAGWYLVQIGRGRYTKRFNLSDSEMRQIATWAMKNLTDG